MRHTIFVFFDAATADHFRNWHFADVMGHADNVSSSGAGHRAAPAEVRK